MSMNGYLLAVTPEQAERLRREPGLVSRVTTGGDTMDGAALSAMLEEGLRGSRAGCLWAWLPASWRRRMIEAVADDDAGGADAADDADPVDMSDFGVPCPLHKEWHLLHFALTGKVDAAPGPAGDAILGGDEVGPDLGYGPARLLTPGAVAAVAAWLGPLGAVGVVGRLDLTAIPEEVYGADFVAEEDPDEVHETLLEAAELLVAFYREAAAKGAAALVWLS
jgi:hypothetical protein